MKKMLISGLAILLTASIGAPIFADGGEEYITASNFTLSNVSVENESNYKLNTQELQQIIDRATGVASDELTQFKTSSANLNSSSQPVTFNYTFNDDKYEYFYEETATSKNLWVTDKITYENIEMTNDIQPQADPITGGIGGRVIVPSTSGNLFESKWKLASVSELSGAPSESTYIYTGLRSDLVEVDANVALNTAGTGPRWRPRLCVKPNGGPDAGVCKVGVGQPDYNKVHSSNGYVPGTTLTTAFWRSYSDPDRGISKAVRLKTTGLAICADAGCYNSTDTNLINILEVNNQNISTMKYFKLLVTIAGPDASISGNVRSTFSGITLDGVSKTPVLDAKDYAQVSISGNSATIIVSK